MARKFYGVEALMYSSRRKLMYALVYRTRIIGAVLGPCIMPYKICVLQVSILRGQDKAESKTASALWIRVLACGRVKDGAGIC